VVVVDGRREVVEGTLLVLREPDLHHDGDLGRKDLPPLAGPAELAGRDEHAGVVPEGLQGLDQGLHRTAGAHHEADLERGALGALVRRGEAGDLSRAGRRHEQGADVGGIRPGATVEVLAHRGFEGGEAGWEDRGVVDEAVEERRERRP
jgi:hypothetical protein